MSQPSQGQDLQEGVYRTPMNLLEAVNRRWPIGFDLAAHEGNCAKRRINGGATCYGCHHEEAHNSLAGPWGTTAGYFWLNPPYGDIGAWTAKAQAEAKKGAKIVMLIPSATGARWLVDHCLGAKIVFLIGRPVFEFINAPDHKNAAKAGQPNTDPYGKDLLLVVFDGIQGVEWWDWRKS